MVDHDARAHRREALRRGVTDPAGCPVTTTAGPASDAEGTSGSGSRDRLVKFRLQRPDGVRMHDSPPPARVVKYDPPRA